MGTLEKRSRFICISAVFALLFGLGGCIGTTSKEADSDSVVIDTNEYHADNDIAMTLRSMMDAMNVDQPLDSAEYDFDGILTDGSGRPLYTDIQGAPGQWSVKVLSPTRAHIKNVYLGDLVPEELTQYIMSSLDIPDSLMVMERAVTNIPNSAVGTYDFGKGQLVMEIIQTKTESGQKGPLVNIMLLKKVEPEIPD